ncbi:pyrroline-5-carboxylate reductase [Paenibacillus taiwanensis]|uniref:pyrroline-5-carboxylate reductase n=1 Tax=Paenibacillus taiwanensis TaxID=401638 RepID=UPI00040B6733|nr:pyrroline-5-carboxylate reductase [Paenibacillus taiwanensis]
MKPTIESNQIIHTANPRYCFFGAGSAAEAFVKGMLDNHITTASHVTMINRNNEDRLRYLRETYGVSASNHDEIKAKWLHEADVIILAMKPKDAIEACKELRPLLHNKSLIVSIIAGLSISTIQQIVGETPVVRTMPNTSSTIGLGATGVCYSAEANAAQRFIAEQMLKAIGIVAEVEESLLDAVTGVSGSGPAYVYYLMEAMIEAAAEEGLSMQQAHELVVQTVRGAAEMVRLTGETPAVLRQKVTSPGGTTQAALNVLNERGVKEAVKEAIVHARARAAEMGEQIGRELR